MIFNPLAFLIGRTVAKNQGAPDATATTDGFLAGILKPTILGVALVSTIARTQASTSGRQSSQLVVTAKALSEDEVFLTWNPVQGADNYEVIRLDRYKRSWNTEVLVFKDDEVEGDTNYFYLVEAYNKNKFIVKSSLVSVMTPP